MTEIIGNVTNEEGIAVTGKATGTKGVGVRGEGGASGVQGYAKAWHGVAGLSESTTGGYGIYGKNTAGGTGVAGESDEWMGVYGRSKSSKGGAGVLGEGDPGTGVVGRSTKWVGVYGETAGIENGPAGVWGEHKGAGIGVKAISNTGVGLVAFSNGTAAVFQGDVEVTGELTIKRVSIHALLQRIIQLEEAVAALRSRPIDVSTSPSIPQIRVTREGSGAGSIFVIEGSGFLPNEAVNIRVVDDALQTLNFPHSSDESGKIGIRQNIPCKSGFTLHFSATDSRSNPDDITGVLWSNTFTTICP